MTIQTRRRGSSRRRPAPGDLLSRRGRHPHREQGMVTAELAAALPTLALILVMAVWGIAYAGAQLRCTDAAREAARAAARGEDMDTVVEIAGRIAPEHADVDIRTADGLLTIEVRANVGAPVPGGSSLGATVRGKAVALEERP